MPKLTNYIFFYAIEKILDIMIKANSKLKFASFTDIFRGDLNQGWIQLIKCLVSSKYLVNLKYPIEFLRGAFVNYH